MDDERDGGLRVGATLLVALAVGLVLLLLAAFVLLGARGVDAATADDRLGPTIRVDALQPNEFDVPRVVRGLADDLVVTVDARGFGADVDGTARQCTGGAVAACGAVVPVRFDGGGHATFLFFLDDAVGGKPCGLDRCVLVVEDDGDEVAVVALAFGGGTAAPAPRVRIAAGVAVDDGATVDVALEGFAAGERVRVALCRPPGYPYERHCGAPGPETRVTVDAGGAGTARLVVAAGAVGRGDAGRCERGSPCAIVAFGERTPAVAAFAPVRFSAGPSADYDAGRLAGGIAVAALLAALAVWLGTTTDWRGPEDPFADVSVA